MKNATIILPVNLFSEIETLVSVDSDIYLVEDPRYFTDFGYHKLKLAYHFATMNKYFSFLKGIGYTVKYIYWDAANPTFYSSIKKKYDKITIIEPGDDTLIKKIKKSIPNLEILDTPNFLITRKEIIDNQKLFTTKSGNRKFTNFYAFQRKRLNILVNKNGEPQGGKWSYDKENRKPFPKNVNDIPSPTVSQRKHIKTIKYAVDRANDEFPDNYGECTVDNLIYPITFEDADLWLDKFLKERFKNFGTFEDAAHSSVPFGWHSVISPMMNIGLLPDNVVLDAVDEYRTRIPIASFEGFIRQVIGWRNYVWAIYVLDRNELKNANQYESHEKIPYKQFWTGTTGILPIDTIIKKIITTAYAHHIERLMYLGTWMLINNISPQETYKIFMEWTIDAYEWVMIPNITMTSNNSDKMMSRMYINSSNYILKMSDYKRGPWCEIWDDRYRKFILKHQKKLAKNYATARQVANVRRVAGAATRAKPWTQ
jgi:deoxyribodipyrimidine photolyase-related protein